MICAVLVAVSLQAKQETKLPVGWDAPPFEAQSSVGKPLALASLLKEGPVGLYFIRATCPINSQAAPHIKEIANAFGPAARIYGVIDGDLAVYNVWQEEFKAPYPVIFDPKFEIVKSYKVSRSPWFILIGADGKVQSQWNGYSAGYLKDITAQLAASWKVSTPNLTFKGAPVSVRHGCAF